MKTKELRRIWKNDDVLSHLPKYIRTELICLRKKQRGSKRRMRKYETKEKRKSPSAYWMRGSVEVYKSFWKGYFDTTIYLEMERIK